MKSLLLMADDGMSGLVWLQMARNHLQAGKTVLAITDPLNIHEAIGTGDGLPGYRDGLTGHPGFRTTTAGREDAAALLQKLKALDDDTVVMFNMSPFEFVSVEPQWRDVLSFCAQSSLEMVLATYYPVSLWMRDLAQLMRMGSEVPALTGVDWDYIAGYQLVTESNVDDVRQVFPGLAGQVAVPGNHTEPMVPGEVTWQVINRMGTYESRAVYAQLEANIASLPALWDVRHGHQQVANPTPAATAMASTVFRRLMLALRSL